MNRDVGLYGRNWECESYDRNRENFRRLIIMLQQYISGIVPRIPQTDSDRYLGFLYNN